MSANRDIFILGLSGSGKTTIADHLAQALQLLHVNLDGRDRLRYYGLRPAWGRYFGASGDAGLLVRVLHELSVKEGKTGTVLSFPSTTIISWEKVQVAHRADIRSVVLWGSWDLCEQAQARRSNGADHERYERSNREAFISYGQPEFADIRVDVFAADDSRLPMDRIVDNIMKVVAI